MFQFYSAARTGRWAGRLIQLQNLPQNHLPDLSAARSLTKANDDEMLELLYEDIPDTLSQLIRTAFIPEVILRAIISNETVKWAFNASFERICLSAWLRRHRPDLFRGYGEPDDGTGNYLNPVSWRCSRIWAATLGLPLSLEGVGAVLKLTEQKMTEGKALICRQCWRGILLQGHMPGVSFLGGHRAGNRRKHRARCFLGQRFAVFFCLLILQMIE